MKLCYILLLVFIVKIYSSGTPKVCQTTGDSPTERDCIQTDCDAETTQKKLYDKKCYTPVANCKTYQAGTDECNQCEDDYSHPAATIATLGTDLDKKCYTTAKIANCKNVNPNYDACYECDTDNDYDFNEDHICVKYITGCKTYNDGHTACTACYPGFGTAPGCSCSGKDLGDICVDQNCDTYSADAKCTKCNNGYKLVSGACSSCGTNINSDGTKCLSTAFCVEDSSDGKCTKCELGYYKKTSGNSVTCVACTTVGSEIIVGDECKAPASGSGVEGCADYKDTTTCARCEDYLHLDGNSCKPCYFPQTSYYGLYCYTSSRATNCLSYNYAEDKCTACPDTYTLQSDGTCKQQTCTTCGGGGDDGGNGGDNKGSGEASNSSAMKLNIIFMAIMLMIVA